MSPGASLSLDGPVSAGTKSSSAVSSVPRNLLFQSQINLFYQPYGILSELLTRLVAARVVGP
jgi:hypothetical protein